MEEAIDDEFGELYADVLERFPPSYPSPPPSPNKPLLIPYSSEKYPLAEDDPRIIEYEQSLLFRTSAGDAQVSDDCGIPDTPDFGPGFYADEGPESSDDDDRYDERAEMGDDEEMEFRGLDDRELGKTPNGARVLVGNEEFDVGFGEREKIGAFGLNDDVGLKNSGEEEEEPVDDTQQTYGGGSSSKKNQFHLGFGGKYEAIETRVLEDHHKGSDENGGLQRFPESSGERDEAIESGVSRTGLDDDDTGNGNFNSQNRLEDLDFDPAFIELLGGDDNFPVDAGSDFYGETSEFNPAYFYGIGEMQEKDSDSDDDDDDDMKIILNSDENSWDGNPGKDLCPTEAIEGQDDRSKDPQGEDFADREEDNQQGDAPEMTVQSDQDHSLGPQCQEAVEKSIHERSTDVVRAAPCRDNSIANVRASAQPCGAKSGGSAPRFSFTGPGGSAWGYNSSRFARGARTDFRFPSHMRILNVNIDDFDEKPWRRRDVDLSDYFNFDMDESKWKDYCGKVVQLCRSMQNRSNSYVYSSERRKQHFGQAIQVQVGADERLPSKDAKQPRLSDSGVIIEVGTSTAVSTKGNKNIHGDEIQPFPLDSTHQFYSDVEHRTKHHAEERETQSDGSTDGTEEGEIVSDKMCSGDTLDEESLTHPVENPRRIPQFEPPTHYASDGENFSWYVQNSRKYIERPEMRIRGGSTRGRGALSRHHTQFDGTRYPQKRNFSEREDNKPDERNWRNNNRESYGKYRNNYDTSENQDEYPDYPRPRRRNRDYDDYEDEEEEKNPDENYRPWKDFNQRKRENFNYSGQRRGGYPRMRYRGNLQYSDGYQKRKGWVEDKFGRERFDQPRKYDHYDNPRNERRPGSYNGFNGGPSGSENRWQKGDGQRKRGNYQQGNQIVINSSNRNHVDLRNYCNNKVNAESSSRVGRNYSETTCLVNLHRTRRLESPSDEQDPLNHHEDSGRQDLKRGRSKLERWRQDDWDEDSFNDLCSPQETENEHVEEPLAVGMDSDLAKISDLRQLIKIGEEFHKL